MALSPQEELEEFFRRDTKVSALFWRAIGEHAANPHRQGDGGYGTGARALGANLLQPGGSSDRAEAGRANDDLVTEACRSTRARIASRCQIRQREAIGDLYREPDDAKSNCRPDVCNSIS